MNYQDIQKAAKGHTGLCYACPVCNGVACKNTIPGPGAKGMGGAAARNYNAWQNIYLNLDTICRERPVDTSCELFGKKYPFPIFAAPIGAVNEHYSQELKQEEYDEELIRGCAMAGVEPFTGDGLHDEYFPGACKIIDKYNTGIVTIKPWAKERVFQRIDMAKAHNVQVMCMDIDGAGLPMLKNANPPSGSKTVEELREIIEYAGVPFIIKGIMTPAGAIKAKEAGATAIVVSNHGGRVLDQGAATAWVLPEIADAVGNDITVLVDGGIRTGSDVFKALALGAHGVLVGRPIAVCVYGGGAEAVNAYLQQLASELQDAMQMCGPRTLAEINRSHIMIR